jgi:hypothetical protein
MEDSLSVLYQRVDSLTLITRDYVVAKDLLSNDITIVAIIIGALLVLFTGLIAIFVPIQVRGIIDRRFENY